MEREIQRLSWTKVKNLVPRQIDTVIIPVGTVEAHGSIALGTDNVIPEAMARSQAEKLNALVAPVLNYGITKSLYHYPGANTILPEHYVPFMEDIFRSFAHDGFKNVIVFNGHGGNNSALKDAAYKIHYECGLNIAAIHWWMLVDELTKEHFGEDGGHAGINETAMVQAIDPAMVDKNEYKKEMAFNMKPGADIYPAPGTILLYRENEGHPNFDLEQAKSYFQKVCDAVGDYAVSIIKQWQQLD